VVTNEVASRYTLMIAAATVRRRRVLRIRAARRSFSVAPSALTSGIMLTPVSNPDSPSTSLGKASTAVPSMAHPLPPWAEVNACRHPTSWPGCAASWANPTATTTALSSRYPTTKGMAMLTASLNPARNTAPNSTSSPRVIATCWSQRNPGVKGFSTIWAVASAEDRVMVMIQEVATKPSRHSTNSLPPQNDSSRSSIATEPWPWGLSAATRR
jgi:hypothetical protein